MYVVSTGNAFDGIELIGPFTDREDAVSFAEDGRNGCDEWNIVELMPVADLSGVED